MSLGTTTTTARRQYSRAKRKTTKQKKKMPRPNPRPKMSRQRWRQLSRDRPAGQRICQEVVRDPDQDQDSRAEPVAGLQVTPDEVVVEVIEVEVIELEVIELEVIEVEVIEVEVTEVEVTTIAGVPEVGHLPDRSVIGRGATGSRWRRARCRRAFTSNEAFLSLSGSPPRESSPSLRTSTAW